MTTFTVSSTSDSGLGSLREAIAQANALAGADTIVFNPTFFPGGAANLIRLTSGQIAITDAVTINGSAVGGVTITGDANNNDVTLAGTDITDVAASGAALLADNSRIFTIADGATTTLQSLTLTGGRTQSNGAFSGGGAVFALGALTLVDSTVAGNSTAGDGANGGGIAGFFVTLTNTTVSGNATSGSLALGGGVNVFQNSGTFITLTNSTVSGNFTTGANASGGGLKGSDVTLINSTVSGNSVAGTGADGGGVQSSSTVTLTNSTVSGNAVTGDDACGGGITATGDITLTNSTLSGNSVTGQNSFGGGIAGFSAVTLTNSTLSGNSATGQNSYGGGIAGTSAVTLTNSIVLGNASTQSATGEISGTIVANGLNIVGTGADTDPADHIINADPSLVFAGPLANNGGPVQTIALKLDAANPALDAGDDTLAPAQDARGSSRSDVGGVAHNGANISDLGAFELQNTTQTLYFVATSGNTLPNGDPLVGFPQNFELWRLEPGGQAEIAADIIPGAAGSYPTFFTKFNNQLFFSAYTPQTGRELWKVASDGTVSLAADLVPGPDGSNPFFHELDDESDYTTVEYKGELYFNASTPTTGRELFKVKADGSVVLVADLAPGQDDSSPLFGNSNVHFIFNDEFYFDTIEGTHALWKIKADGSVHAVPLPNGATLHASPEFTPFNGSMYFTGEHAGGGGRLFQLKPDGNVVQLADAQFPEQLTTFDNALYFRGYDADHGYELWRVRASGFVERFADINTGQGGMDSSVPSDFHVMDGALYFNADSFDDVTFITDRFLWKLAPGGQPTPVSDALITGDPITFNGVTYFMASDVDHGLELWKVTNTGVVLAADINPGQDSSFNGPTEFVAFNGNLYFNAITDAEGQELWKIAANGTISLVMDINLGPNHSHPFATSALSSPRFTEHAILNGELYFAAEDADGTQLWKIKADGSVVKATNVPDGGAGYFLNVLEAGSSQPGNNTPPIAVADAFTVAEGGNAAALTGGATSVLANDTDTESDPLTAILVNGPAHGSLTLNPNGTFSYSHDGSETTSDSFTYKVNDGVSDSAPVAVSITVTPVNDAPVVSGPVTLSAIPENSGARLITQAELLAHTSDADGPSLAAVNLQIAAGTGLLVDNSNGTWSFTPAPDDDTSVTFSYQVTDGTTPVATSATLDITPPAVPGTGGDDSFEAPPGVSAFDAGLGVDTMTFGFKLTEAIFAWSGNTVIVTHGADQTVLSGFEVFKFTDGTVNNNDGNPLVDDLFYYSTYHDVWNAHLDADADYNGPGWHAGRDPNAFFSTATYLSANPDVKAAGVNPLTHFDTAGWKEGRLPSINFDPAQYLDANPDVAAGHIDPLLHYLQSGYQEGRVPFAPSELIAANGFDYAYYLQHNPDVAAAGVDPFQHFQTVGWKEGRNPNALFDTTGYLNTYTDVKAANVNPLDHYNTFGWHEGRDPSVGFDTTSYLAAYGDVQAANVNPLTHFLHFGIHEGRSPFADGVWG